ncbi:hypothetical protein PIB30_080851 [Stylosanthes scabra]|uniref:Uncharacterized protein n=1 Tax=Stylosanthes scabra TaxID=79078 RepID=A0ABU6TR28_9FABA|nr:hypothetical protein [Stylosanthes scabra]
MLRLDCLTFVQRTLDGIPSLNDQSKKTRLRMVKFSGPLSLFLPPSTAPPPHYRPSPLNAPLFAGALLHCTVAAHSTTFEISSLSSFLVPPHRVAAASSASTSDSGKALIEATRQSTTPICALASFTRAVYSSYCSRDLGDCCCVPVR